MTATPSELFDVADAMARSRAPGGDRVGIVTHSGGTAILLSDLAAERDLHLPTPSPALTSDLTDLLDHGTTANPLDMGGIMGGPHRFAEVVSSFARSGEYDVVLAVSTPHPPAHSVARAESLVALAGDGPPIVHLWMAGDQAERGLAILRAAGAAVVTEPQAAITALAGLVEFEAAGADQMAVASSGGEDSPPPEGDLTESRAKELLAGLGIPSPPGGLAVSAEEAKGIAARVGLPVAVKVSSPQIDHKGSVDGVRLGIDDLEAVAAAFDAVTSRAREAAPDASIEGALVERQRTGAEVIAGAVIDETFGPVVLVGLGGLLAEVVDDVVFAPAPVAAMRVHRLLERLRTHPRLLEGTDVEALSGIVARLGDWFVRSAPPVTEVEINPLVWTGTDWEAVDALVRVGG